MPECSLYKTKLKICLNCILTILCSFPEVNLVFKLRFLLCLYLESINEIVSPSSLETRVYFYKDMPLGTLRNCTGILNNIVQTTGFNPWKNGGGGGQVSRRCSRHRSVENVVS